MTVADYRDQLGIFDPASFTWPVHVIGLGGIGSALLPLLFKIGVSGELHVWDNDDVEPHNTPAQLMYRKSDVGKPKGATAQAFAQFIEAECDLIVHNEWVTADTPLEGVVISGVDSMKSRASIWEAVKASCYLIPLYMDGRIGGEEYQLLSLNPSLFEATERYETWLFDDSEGAQLPCAERTNIHTPVALAADMVANLTLFSRDLSYKFNVRKHMKATQFRVEN